MSEQLQQTRWRFESDHAALIVYHRGEKIAHFAGGAFETEDQTVAEALRGHGELCHEVAIAPIPIVIENPQPAQPAKKAHK